MSLFPRKRVKKTKFKLRTHIDRLFTEGEEKVKHYKSGKIKKRVSSSVTNGKTVKRRVKFKNNPVGTVKKDIYKQHGKRIKAHKIKD